MFHSSIGEPPDELRALLASEAHVWVSDLETWRRAPLLTAEEEARARTLRHPDAQASFVAGRSLVRFVLSHYADVEPISWHISANRLGRPEIIGPGSASKLRFNLSHTQGLAACVVTATADCGIDVERLERPLRPLRIAEHSFAPEEFEDLEPLITDELRERFFCYWTLKESYYKARGSGIPFRMTGARFRLEGKDDIDFLPSKEEETDETAWQFTVFRPTDQHVMAAALAPGPGQRFEMQAFSSLGSTPGDRSSPSFARADLEILRASRTEIAA